MGILISLTVTAMVRRESLKTLINYNLHKNDCKIVLKIDSLLFSSSFDDSLYPALSLFLDA